MSERFFPAKLSNHCYQCSNQIVAHWQLKHQELSTMRSTPFASGEAVRRRCQNALVNQSCHMTHWNQHLMTILMIAKHFITIFILLESPGVRKSGTIFKAEIHNSSLVLVLQMVFIKATTQNRNIHYARLQLTRILSAKWVNNFSIIGRFILSLLWSGQLTFVVNKHRGVCIYLAPTQIYSNN